MAEVGSDVDSLSSSPAFVSSLNFLQNAQITRSRSSSMESDRSESFALDQSQKLSSTGPLDLTMVGPSLSSHPTPGQGDGNRSLSDSRSQASLAPSNGPMDKSSAENSYSNILTSPAHAKVSGENMPSGGNGRSNMQVLSPRKGRTVKKMTLVSIPTTVAAQQSGSSVSEKPTDGAATSTSGQGQPPAKKTPTPGAPADGVQAQQSAQARQANAWGNGSATIRAAAGQSRRKAIKDLTVQLKMYGNIPHFDNNSYKQLLAQLNLNHSHVHMVGKSETELDVYWLYCKTKDVRNNLLRTPFRNFMGGNVRVTAMGEKLDYHFKVIHLPFWVSDEPLVAALQEYGDVTNLPAPEIKELPGVKTMDRHYTIRLKEDKTLTDLPVRFKVIDIDEPSASYSATLILNDLKRCLKCEGSGHHSNECPEENCRNCKPPGNRKHTTAVCRKNDAKKAAAPPKAAAKADHSSKETPAPPAGAEDGAKNAGQKETPVQDPIPATGGDAGLQNPNSPKMRCHHVKDTFNLMSALKPTGV